MTRARGGPSRGSRVERVRALGGAATGVLTTLVVPVTCAGCGREDVALCRPCRDCWDGPGSRAEDQAGRLDRLDGRPVLPVWAVAPYVGPVRSMVVAWKDRGRVDLQPLLRAALVREAQRRRGAVRQGEAVRLVVVPVPSSPGAVRHRGADLVGDLARDVAGAWGVSCLSVLRMRSRKRDQVGLGARDRARNLQDAVRIDDRALGTLDALDRHGWPHRPVVAVLVDDIMTTGATLATCENVLRTQGITVIAGLCLAATPPPGSVGRATLGEAG